MPIIFPISNWRKISMELNINLDEKKLDTIKLRILEMEADNIVKKESKSAMEEKIKKMIISEVDKK